MKRFTRLAPDLISRDTLVWVLLAQAVSIVPLLFKLPVWVAAVWLAALLWRVQIFRGAIGFPNTWLKVLLGVSCVGLVLASYAGVAGVEPMVGFLVCSFTLKLIEMHTRKDALIILFIGFIAIAAQFLFAQNIAAAAYGVFSFWVLITSWRAVLSQRSLTWRRQLGLSAVTLAQSVPMLLVMFLIMPRLGPLWSVPLPQGQGQTGFSDSLELGDIGELVKSYDLAFQAEFEGLPPAPETLYWRGLILDQFDGRRWRASNQWLFSRANDGEHAGGAPLMTYRVIMEPHQQQWLFTLGFPLTANSAQTDIRRTRSGLLNATRPVAQKLQYEVTSTQQLLNEADTLERDLEGQLQYPAEYNPRTQALAKQWRAAGLSDNDFIERALALYRERFFYTLKPGPLSTHAIDDFLFATQEGFCEHFASSFVFLLRVAGIPARLVVGYQGGAANPSGFLSVRQADAHAWAEVWLPEQGWVSIDPTAAVAPNRIRLGVEEALGADDRQLLASSRWHRGVLMRLQNQWEAMGYSWQRFVLNYDNDQKDAFLSRWLGGASPWRVALAFVAFCVLVVAAIAVGFWAKQQRRRLPPEDRWVAALNQRLAQMGYPREPRETLQDYFHRVAEREPLYRNRLQRVADAYYRVKYRADPQAMQPLREACASVF